MLQAAVPSPAGHSGLGRSELLAAALLVGAVWLVYWRSLDVPFICDDAITVVENESLRHLWPLWGDGERPGPLAPVRDLPTSGRPLVNASFALNYQLNGLSPRGYRVVNIFLHTVNALLLAALLRRTLRLRYFQGRFDAGAGAIAFVVALLWAMHPLVTETVVYVTQRTELMVSCCYLATLYASLRFWESRRPGWCLVAVLACWAGMASKEVMAAAPLLVLLFDRTFLSETLREAWQKSRPMYVGLFSSWLLLVCLAGPGPRSASAGFHLGIPATDWWLTQSQVLLMYLRLVVWPWPLSIHYEPPYLTSLGEAWMYVLPVAVLVVGTLVLLWRRSAAGYLAAFALTILAPTLLVPIATEIVAERRMYLPLAAILALFVVGGCRLLAQRTTPWTSLVATVSIALLLAAIGGVVSSARLAEYRDEITLWQNVVERDPANATAQYNVGTAYLERNEPQRAIEYFERAIAVRPDYARAHHNLGAALAALGRTDDAEQEFARAVELEPRYAMGHVKLGLAALQADDLDAARKNFETALRLQPNDADAHSGMANLLLQTGQLEDAIHHAHRAIEAAPGDASAHNTLGAALAQQQQFTEAIAHFELAVKLDPALLQAWGNLMAAHAAAGRSQDAMAAAEKALAAAREAGDAAMVAQIEKFLAEYQAGNSQAEASDATND